MGFISSYEEQSTDGSWGSTSAALNSAPSGLECATQAWTSYQVKNEATWKNKYGVRGGNKKSPKSPQARRLPFFPTFAGDGNVWLQETDALSK